MQMLTDVALGGLWIPVKNGPTAGKSKPGQSAP